MKWVLLALVGFALCGCQTTASLKPVGSRSKEGVPVGEFRFLSANGSTVAQGRFTEGKLDGIWRFWDSGGSKTAEITYDRGIKSGPFRLYYGSFLDPSAGGKLKAEGNLKADKQVGEHVAYLTTGDVESRSVIKDAGEIEASVGTSDLARRLMEADDRLFPKLEGAVLGSLHK
jgi:hypothetical protein